MNIGELLGAMVQTGMSPSSSARMKNSLGGGKELDSLKDMRRIQLRRYRRFTFQYVG